MQEWGTGTESLNMVVSQGRDAAGRLKNLEITLLHIFTPVFTCFSKYTSLNDVSKQAMPCLPLFAEGVGTIMRTKEKSLGSQIAL